MAAWGPGWGEETGQEDERKKDGRCGRGKEWEFSHVDRIRSKVDKMYWTVNNIRCGTNTSLRSCRARRRGQGLKLPYLLLPLSALSTKAFLRKWNRKTTIARLNASDSCVSLICNIQPEGNLRKYAGELVKRQQYFVLYWNSPRREINIKVWYNYYVILTNFFYLQFFSSPYFTIKIKPVFCLIN